MYDSGLAEVMLRALIVLACSAALWDQEFILFCIRLISGDQTKVWWCQVLHPYDSSSCIGYWVWQVGFLGLTGHPWKHCEGHSCLTVAFALLAKQPSRCSPSSLEAKLLARIFWLVGGAILAVCSPAWESKCFFLLLSTCWLLRCLLTGALSQGSFESIAGTSLLTVALQVVSVG